MSLKHQTKHNTHITCRRCNRHSFNKTKKRCVYCRFLVSSKLFKPLIR